MLEGLDKINWADYRHAYGVATNIPELLRKLISDNPTALPK